MVKMEREGNENVMVSPTILSIYATVATGERIERRNRRPACEIIGAYPEWEQLIGTAKQREKELVNEEANESENEKGVCSSLAK